jgi:hypothetical protein
MLSHKTSSQNQSNIPKKPTHGLKDKGKHMVIKFAIVKKKTFMIVLELGCTKSCLHVAAQFYRVAWQVSALTRTARQSHQHLA